MAPIALILEIESESETVSLSLDCETPSAVRAFVAGLGLFGQAKESLPPISYAAKLRERETRAKQLAELDAAHEAADTGDAVTRAKQAREEGKRHPFYPRMERRGDVWVVVDASDPAFEPLLEWAYDGDTEVLVAASALHDDGAPYQWRIASVLEGPPGFFALADSDSELEPSKAAFERLAMAAWQADKLEAATRERYREEEEKLAAVDAQLAKLRHEPFVVLAEETAPLDHAADEDLPASAPDLQTLPGAELQAVEDAVSDLQEEFVQDPTFH